MPGSEYLKGQLAWQMSHGDHGSVCESESERESEVRVRVNWLLGHLRSSKTPNCSDIFLLTTFFLQSIPDNFLPSTPNHSSITITLLITTKTINKTTTATVLPVDSVRALSRDVSSYAFTYTGVHGL